MAKNKTFETTLSVDDYLNAISDPKRRADCIALSSIISNATGLAPKMWGTAIVGFGSYHYKYESGHEGDAPLAGFSSRSNAIAIYLAASAERRAAFLQKFGKHKTGKGCIYIQKLEDIDAEVLGEMSVNSVSHLKSVYPD